MEFNFLKNPAVIKLFDLFESNNRKIYVVGGAVRNALLGIESTDFDFATTTKPDEVVEILKNNNIPVDLKGLKFGCVTANIDNTKIDITTFRKDCYKNGSRFPTIEYSTRIADDYNRRDFTVNALYVDRTGRIIDLGTGLEDLKKGVLKFIIHPKKSIYFDPLRVFRYFRFCSLYFHKNFDRRSLEVSISKLHKARKSISRQRVQEEIDKILAGEGADVILNVWRHYGILYELDGYIDNTKLEMIRSANNEH